MDWIHLTHFQGFDWCPSLLVGFPDSSVGKAPTCKAGDPSSIPGPGRSAGERIGLFLGFPSGSAGKESACKAAELRSIPGLGRSPGGGKGYPLQYSGLENSMDCTVHGVAKSRTQLAISTFSSPDHPPAPASRALPDRTHSCTKK